MKAEFNSAPSTTEPIPVVPVPSRATRAQAHNVAPSVVRAGDVLRLGFIACYVISSTVCQIAVGALLVYLIPA